MTSLTHLLRRHYYLYYDVTNSCTMTSLTHALWCHREYVALNVYVALCYYKLDYYDVSQEVLAIYLQVYIYLYMCVCVWVRARARARVCVCVFEEVLAIYLQVYIYICVCVCLCACARARVCVCVCLRRSLLFIFRYVCLIYINVYTYPGLVVSIWPRMWKIVRQLLIYVRVTIFGYTTERYWNEK